MTTEDPKVEKAGPAGALEPQATPVRGPAPVEAPAPSIVDRTVDVVTRHWPLMALLSSALLLATAHAFEKFGGLAPCHLCLKQREVYWVAGTVGLVGLILQRTPLWPRLRLPVALLLGAIFLYGAGLATYHAGAEWKWWPGPKTCSGGDAAAASNLEAMLKGTAAIKPPACDKAAWVFLGLSMAGWNVLISLKLAVWSVLAAFRKSETPA
ncbi:disulfide bond formation protein DsbB [Caulobacter sp. BE264]|uniref:disulfide bond formation protein B n=1 Tax=Caulobacter sp. BE264 TaxID=2817724 RepID=UPI0028558FB3|nr:disulfide bond formation protein B [Caulobacter sp. BE264]MDR7229956.1 disulfide bond formation protein DsbB [Caulobacter sp. BE264]